MSEPPDAGRGVQPHEAALPAVTATQLFGHPPVQLENPGIRGGAGAVTQSTAFRCPRGDRRHRAGSADLGRTQREAPRRDPERHDTRMNRAFALARARAGNRPARLETIGFHNGRHVTGAGGGGVASRRRCDRLSHPTLPSGPQISGISSSRSFLRRYR